MNKVFAIVIAAALSGCSSQAVSPDAFDAAQAVGGASAPQHPSHIVGRAYYKSGKLVRPRHQPDYSAIGVASWYGSEHSGQRTANGEVSDSTNLFAAHATLPLPSYVSVENLDNGKILTVRVHDRSPIAPGSVIGLSERTAELLGLKRLPNARVHIKYLSPAPIEVRRHASR